MSQQNLTLESAADVPAAQDLGRWFRVIGLFAVTGLILTGYLSWAALTTTPVAGCGSGGVFDCGHVLTSQWSKVVGIPVSVPAFALYCTLLSALACWRVASVGAMRQMYSATITVCGIVAGLAAIWFTGLQFLTMDHLCPWCLAAHTCGLGILAILLWKHPAGFRQTVQLSAVSMAAVVLLATIQGLTPAPQKYVVVRYDDNETDANSSEQTDVAQAPVEGVIDDTLFSPPDDIFAAPGGDVFEPPTEATSTSVDALKEAETEQEETSSKAAATLLMIMAPQLICFSDQVLASADEPSHTETAADSESSTDQKVNEQQDNSPQPRRRLISVNGNRFRLDIRQWPLLGEPEARYVFVEMFDYTCQHCRNTNRAIKGAFRHFGDDLAVITLPVPLDRKCNPSAKSSGGVHRESCEISRIAVAVWRIDPTKFHELHDWILQSSRTARATRHQAEKLVGREALQKELNYPTAAEYIARHTQLYKRVGAGTVPKLMFPNASMVGEVSSTSVLCKRIERELAGNQ